MDVLIKSLSKFIATLSIFSNKFIKKIFFIAPGYHFDSFRYLTPISSASYSSVLLLESKLRFWTRFAAVSVVFAFFFIQSGNSFHSLRLSHSCCTVPSLSMSYLMSQNSCQTSFIINEFY